MASRVLYGLARQGELPAALGRVGERTRTPVLATTLTTVLILALALALPLGHLAELTSRLTLVVFGLVNVSLIVIKRRAGPTASGGYEAPVWMPWAGAFACALLLILDAATRLWP